jgi:hypothetical protein
MRACGGPWVIAAQHDGAIIFMKEHPPELMQTAIFRAGVINMSVDRLFSPARPVDPSGDEAQAKAHVNHPASIVQL